MHAVSENEGVRVAPIADAGASVLPLAGAIRRARHVYRVPAPLSVALIVLPWVIAIVMWLLIVKPSTHALGLRLVEEDGWVENLTFGADLLAGILGLALARGARRAGGHRVLATYYTLVGLFFIMVAMEEISWGQRIFGWNTPSGFADLNLHGETNLHNLPILENLEYPAILAMAVAGIVSARLFRRSWIRAASAPSILDSLLVVIAISAGVSLRLLPWPPSGSALDLDLYKFEEVMEMLFGFAGLFYVWLNLRMLGPEWRKGAVADRSG